MDQVDICIVGAGVVGLAIARELAVSRRVSNPSIVLLDQQNSFGQGISSRNSEVIHGGIYYAPDSLKAKLCIKGKALLYDYLREKQIAHRQIGKLIVGQKHQEAELKRIQENAARCGMDDLHWLNKPQIETHEPSVSCCFGLLSSSTGIVDSHALMLNLLHDCQQQNVVFTPNTQVLRVCPQSAGFNIATGIRSNNSNLVQDYSFHTKVLINTAGLEAHLLSRCIDDLPDSATPRVYYCKGDYFSYSKRSPFSHLIYPVPEPNTAGLGIHSTLDLNNQLKFGPDVEYIDEISYRVKPEKRLQFARSIQAYFPQLDADALQPAYAGIRPKLSGPGEPPADFLIQTSEVHGLTGLVQLFGIESPGLTACLAIGKEIAALAEVDY